MCTISVKLKFRPSTAEGQVGRIFFQVIHGRTVRLVSSDYQLYESEWNGGLGAVGRARDAERVAAVDEVRRAVSADLERWKRVLALLEQRKGSFGVDDVVAEYCSLTERLSLFRYMEEMAARLAMLGRRRTSETYRATLNIVRLYRGGRDVTMDCITSDGMLMFESWMSGRGLCRNTTSFYMRVLRCLFNRAVEEGLVEQTFPFRRVYTGIGKTVKRAVAVDYIRRMKNLDLPAGSTLAFARDMFLFSFYTRGMAFVDIAHLRKSDVTGGFICYRRHKTGQLITVRLESCMTEIIARYADDSSPYLLPIIKDASDGYRQYRNALRLVNCRLKEIGEMIGAPIKLTTYVGRHSWGSAAKANNIPLAVISESMGHNSERTTQIYLASLDTSVVDSANAKILKKLQDD
jgi:integrase